MLRYRIFRFLGLFIGTIVILIALVIAYLLTGTSDAQTQMHYTITLPDPSAQTLTVSLTLQPGPMPFLDLYLRDPVQNGHHRVTSFTAQRNGKPVSTWQTLPIFPDAVRLWNGFSTDPITVTYQVDPLWMKGEDSPRSYLGSEFAYIRGMVTLYSTLSLNDILLRNFDHPGTEAGFAEVDVLLPQGWKMVSPFGSGKIAAPVAYLRNSYFGFGPFDLQDLTLEETSFLLGVYDGLPSDRRAVLGQQIPLLFETMQKMTGFSPVSDTCYWALTILPHEPIHGGASGTGSLVVEDDIKVIAHEMFHWWNGTTLVTTDDANWLKEGFTTYYAAKSLFVSGVWTNEDFSYEIGKFQAKFWGRDLPRAVNLIDASNQLVKQNHHDAYDSVYYGGALLAYHLDQQLKTQGKSIDALWPILNNLHRPASTADFLKALEATGGADLARQAEDILNGREIMRFPNSLE